MSSFETCLFWISFFNWIICFLAIGSFELLICFGYFIGYFVWICGYFNLLPYACLASIFLASFRLPVHSVDFFVAVQFFLLDVILFVYF
jgi:hypothetical protein